ncbi:MULTISPECIES: proteasome-type protease [Marinobacter]|jgi:putative proteasome-type protease|uniref:proteasome-type protease n=1 Tax=Marinobacter TaxID=2742 RepID=UPI00200671B9|nr:MULTISPECIES: proteasome-type protease [Marinobacter]MCK7551611.1 proteasome-type protease [Marinobacter goseongensis]MDV3504353.1 proteasome-type protease [Marinobacter sp. M-5]
MTYCVAMRLADGLVFASDSRTNAGFDQISTFRKMHVFEQPGERELVILSAGNLATSQSVISLLEKRAGSEEPNVFSTTSMFETAEIVGKTIREVVHRDNPDGRINHVDFSCSLILGGQISGEESRLFNIYPEGNFIEATVETPYFQIGESKYGKPILDRVVSYQSSLDRAYQCALISFDSTMKSNLSVGMPIDVAIYRNDELKPCFTDRVGEYDDYFHQLRQQWHQGIQALIEGLQPPRVR